MVHLDFHAKYGDHVSPEMFISYLEKIIKDPSLVNYKIDTKAARKAVSWINFLTDALYWSLKKGSHTKPEENL